jgi:succinoglycan biosynthesis transport protein ExoP
VSDTLMLAREADGVVVSVLVGVSQTARVAETVERLQTVGAEVAGVVVNNVRGGVYGYPYRYARTADPAAEEPETSQTKEG